MNWIAGRQPVLEALRAGLKLEKIIIAKNVQEKGLSVHMDLARKQKIPFFRVPREMLEKSLSPQINHQGIAAVVKDYSYADPHTILKTARESQEPPFLLLLDHLQDPFNLGNLIRTAAAVGVHGVIVPNRRAALLSPAAIKASAGATARVPVAKVGSLAQTLNIFQKEGLWAVGAEAGRGQPFYRLDFSLPLVLVLGSEGRGLSRLLRERCDLIAHIPMMGSLNSINVSVAGGLLMYEVHRQRMGWVK